MQQDLCSNKQEWPAKQQNQFACTSIEEKYAASPVLQYTRTDCESEKRQVIGYEN
jgi:hypothetical protein